MLYTIYAGLVALIFGLAFFLCPASFWRALSAFLDNSLFDLERWLQAHSFIAGVGLVLCGGWFVSVGYYRPTELWPLLLLGVIVMSLGAVYLFAVDRLNGLARFSDRRILLLDQIVIAFRTSFGLVLVLAALYILFKVGVAAKLF